MSSIMVDIKKHDDDVVQQTLAEPIATKRNIDYELCLGETVNDQYVLYGHVLAFHVGVGGIIGQSLSEAQEQLQFLIDHIGEPSVHSITKTCSVKVTTQCNGTEIMFSSGVNNTCTDETNPQFRCNNINVWEEFLRGASKEVAERLLSSGGSKSGGDYDYAMGVV